MNVGVESFLAVGAAVLSALQCMLDSEFSRKIDRRLGSR